jgi:hypothetical protein
MKKVILILLLLLLTSACNKYIVTNVYEQRYTDPDIALVDVYTHLYYYDLDSIYLDLWIPNTMTADTTTIEQKSILKPINNKSVYSFIFSKYIYPSSIYYNFLIRYTGRKKDMQKEAAKPLPQ